MIAGVILLKYGDDSLKEDSHTHVTLFCYYWSVEYT